MTVFNGAWGVVVVASWAMEGGDIGYIDSTMVKGDAAVEVDAVEMGLNDVAGGVIARLAMATCLQACRRARGRRRAVHIRGVVRRMGGC